MSTERIPRQRLHAPERVAEQLLELLPLLKQLVASEAMAAGGLTTSQLRVIGVLSRGPSLSSALARQLRVTPPTATELVEVLVRRGLVERHSTPSDRRVTLLQLSAEGTETWVRVRARALASMRVLLAEMQPDEVQELERGMDRLLAALRQPSRTSEEARDAG